MPPVVGGGAVPLTVNKLAMPPVKWELTCKGVTRKHDGVGERLMTKRVLSTQPCMVCAGCTEQAASCLITHVAVEQPLARVVGVHVQGQRRRRDGSDLVDIVAVHLQHVAVPVEVVHGVLRSETADVPAHPGQFSSTAA